MKLHLIRRERTADGVFGVLTGAGLTLHTMEEDWRNNDRRISCIPVGTYPLRRTIYYRHGYETFEVAQVPNRSRILVHPANTEEDVEGCIGVGLRRGFLEVAKDEDTGERRVKKRAVVSSRAAFDRFMAALEDVDNATLVVEWDPAAAP
jgi:hypothetical protein